MKIVFDPSASKTNQYINMIVDALTKRGFSVYSEKELFSRPSLFHAIQIVHFNWFENIAGRNTLHLLFFFLKRATKLITLRLLGKKIVWTMHNRMPHDQSTLALSKIMVHLMIRFSKLIIIHSRASEEILLGYNPRVKDKICYIPHPDYVGVYGPLQNQKLDTNAPSLQLLFLGAAKPYKNIELLIQSVKSFPITDVHLTIAGKPASEAYRKLLADLSGSQANIRLDLTFIPDDLIPTYLQKTDLLVLPYDLQSSLNSGTALLAFSYSRTVICPEIGTITDLKNPDAVLSYTYGNEEEHNKALCRCISKAIQMKKENPTVFAELGKKMQETVRKENDKEKVTQELAQLYQSLISFDLQKIGE